MNYENICLGCMNQPREPSSCEHCSWQKDRGQGFPFALLPGVVLDNKYLIGRILGCGGFGIVYLALDLQLSTRVAIKEYFPRELATRDADRKTLLHFSGEKADYFNHGLDKFLDEARALARLRDHPGIVTILNFFSANATGYLVMDYLEGINLDVFLVRKGAPLDYDLARDIIMPVLDGLRAVHEVRLSDGAALLHRDIKPQNIFITTQRQIKILDFGAAKYTVGDRSQNLSIVLTPGYAPEEQYRSKGKQGPWTDIYAAAAVIYLMVTGRAPSDSLDRLAGDDLEPPSQLGVSLPGQVEGVLLKALAVHGPDRYQEVAEFQKALLCAEKPISGRRDDPLTRPARSSAQSADPVSEKTFEPQRKSRLPLVAFFLVLLVSLVGIVIYRNNMNSPHKRLERAIGLYLGTSGRLDQQRARQLFLEVGNTGDPMGTMWLARCYHSGRSGFPKDVQYAREMAAKVIEKVIERAESGDPLAVFLLASAYQEGLGIDQDSDLALHWYQQGADLGNVQAMANLGSIYVERQDPDEQKKGAVLIRKAVDQGCVFSMNALGLLFKNGTGIPKDIQQAIYWFETGAEKGNTLCMVNLGDIYLTDVSEDKPKAVSLFQKAAEMGDSYGQQKMGLCYWSDDLGLPRDEFKAVRWFRLSAEQGNVLSQYYLGWSLANGGDGIKNVEESVTWFRRAADQGQVDAQFDLGLCYYQGVGVEQNFSEAVSWFSKAVNQSSKAQFMLGHCYTQGTGLNQDLEEGVFWFKIAAENGHSVAMTELGRAYLLGRGVEEDAQLGLMWLGKASDENNMEADYILGVVYHYGEYAEKNRSLAVYYLKKAAQAGHEKAREKLLNLEESQ